MPRHKLRSSTVIGAFLFLSAAQAYATTLAMPASTGAKPAAYAPEAATSASMTTVSPSAATTSAVSVSTAPSAASATPAATTTAATNATPAPVAATAATAASAAPAASTVTASAAAPAAEPAPAPAMSSVPSSEISLPQRGMNMENVEHIFGTPLEKKDAVGKPPITAWVYTDYVVYFEYNLVLHAVMKTSPFADSKAGSDGG